MTPQGFVVDVRTLGGAVLNSSGGNSANNIWNGIVQSPGAWPLGDNLNFEVHPFTDNAAIVMVTIGGTCP